MNFGLHISFVDLTVCFRISHQHEWNQDLDWCREIAVGYKHRLANQCTSILFDEISNEPYVSWLNLKLDELAHNVHLDISNLDFRLVDYDINYTFGMKATKLKAVPGAAAVDDEETLNAFPKRVTIINKTIYCNPTAQMRPKGDVQDDNFMEMDVIDAIVHIPDVHSCLFQPGFAPFGKGKKLRFTANIDKCIMNVHEKHTEMFFYHGMKAFGVFEFRPWKYSLVDELKKYERFATPEEEAIYIPLYRQFRTEKKLNELSKIT